MNSESPNPPCPSMPSEAIMTTQTPIQSPAEEGELLPDMDKTASASSLPTEKSRKKMSPAYRAVTIDKVVEFTNLYDLWDKETWWVAENIVMPETMAGPVIDGTPCAPAKRYYELFPPTEVGKVDIFISHTWGNKWGLLVASAIHFIDCLVSGDQEFHATMGAGLHHISKKFSKMSRSRSIRVWIDIFAVMQHATDGKAVDVNSLGEVVDASVVTLMVLDKEKAIPLTRVWCLYEMIKTAESFEEKKTEDVPLENRKGSVELKPNHVFHTRIGSSERDLFHPATPEEIKNVFHHVNVEEAQAKYEEDRIFVLDLAAKVQTKKYGKGYTAINKMAKQALANVLSYAES